MFRFISHQGRDHYDISSSELSGEPKLGVHSRPNDDGRKSVQNPALGHD